MDHANNLLIFGIEESELPSKSAAHDKKKALETLKQIWEWNDSDLVSVKRIGPDSMSAWKRRPLEIELKSRFRRDYFVTKAQELGLNFITRVPTSEDLDNTLFYHLALTLKKLEVEQKAQKNTKANAKRLSPRAQKCHKIDWSARFEAHRLKVIEERNKDFVENENATPEINGNMMDETIPCIDLTEERNKAFVENENATPEINGNMMDETIPFIDLTVNSPQTSGPP
jgi:hypothetical protein